MKLCEVCQYPIDECECPTEIDALNLSKMGIEVEELELEEVDYNIDLPEESYGGLYSIVETD